MQAYMLTHISCYLFYLFMLCLCCLFIRKKQEPGLQNLCHCLLLPLWPTDPQISNTTNVCMYEYVSYLLEVIEDVGFFFFLDSGLKGWAKLSG